MTQAHRRTFSLLAYVGAVVVGVLLVSAVLFGFSLPLMEEPTFRQLSSYGILTLAAVLLTFPGAIILFLPGTLLAFRTANRLGRLSSFHYATAGAAASGGTVLLAGVVFSAATLGSMTGLAAMALVIAIAALVGAVAGLAYQAIEGMGRRPGGTSAVGKARG
jgi:hypothetical protein